MSPHRRFAVILAVALVLADALTITAAAQVGKYFYASENGQIAAYTLDPSTGQLREIQVVPYDEIGPITIHPSNRAAYVPTSSTSSASPLSGFEINTDGTLTLLPGFPITVSASYIVFSPNGKFAYTADCRNVLYPRLSKCPGCFE